LPLRKYVKDRLKKGYRVKGEEKKQQDSALVIKLMRSGACAGPRSEAVQTTDSWCCDGVSEKKAEKKKKKKKVEKKVGKKAVGKKAGAEKKVRTKVGKKAAEKNIAMKK
jgi:hypothetical protein